MKPYRIIGIESSPYAVKVRAVMRYRRLPYVWVARMPQYFAETAAVKPLLMPVVQFPDGEYRTDSTPIIRALEQVRDGARSVIPAAPGHGFLCDLIEDMADEWLTKSLFHYRFSSDRDAASGAAWVMDDAHPHADAAELESLVRTFIDRQRSRMPLVGCTARNGPVFERFYGELLALLESHVATDEYLFGTRPSLADFALYGQLHTLSVDPTPRAIMLEHAPRTQRWVGRLDDTSGVEGEWRNGTGTAVRGLVGLACRYYLPFLAANRAALDNGDDFVALDLDGHDYEQPVYRYQGKCFDYLRSRYAALDATDRAIVDPLLADGGCGGIFTAATRVRR